MSLIDNDERDNFTNDVHFTETFSNSISKRTQSNVKMEYFLFHLLSVRSINSGAWCDREYIRELISSSLSDPVQFRANLVWLKNSPLAFTDAKGELPGNSSPQPDVSEFLFHLICQIRCSPGKKRIKISRISFWFCDRKLWISLNKFNWHKCGTEYEIRASTVSHTISFLINHEIIQQWRPTADWESDEQFIAQFRCPLSINRTPSDEMRSKAAKCEHILSLSLFGNMRPSPTCGNY